jgi:hypothetical protein
MRLLPILLLVGCASAQVAARPSVEKALEDGIGYLLKHQNRDGSWGSAGETTGFDVYAPVPGSHHGFKVATTALCVMALRNAARGNPDAARAYERGLSFLVEKGDVRRPTPDVIYNVWAHAYALQALAQAFEDRKDPKIREAAARQVDLLVRYETMYGGWNYYDFAVGAQHPSEWPTSFTTAAALVAFFEARRSGIEIPQRTIDRALKMVRECRKPDGSFLYDRGFWKRPFHMANREKGSLGRSQAGNFALSLYDDEVGEPQLKAGLDRLFKEHHFIEMGRKRQFPHESWYATAGYYYYFGHYYASRILERLRPEDRSGYAKKLADVVMPHQESDGSWWDFDFYGYEKPYGTAFSILILERCR